MITHGHCLQLSPTLTCMAMAKRKKSHLANLSGSLQGKLATGFGSVPVTQIPASCESFRERLARVPWGFGSIFKRKRLWNWPPGNQRRGGVEGQRQGLSPCQPPFSLYSESREVYQPQIYAVRGRGGRTQQSSQV